MCPPPALEGQHSQHCLPSLSQERCDFDEPDYALIDTLFSLAEAHLFMQLVELQDAQPQLLPKPTAGLYK